RQLVHVFACGAGKAGTWQACRRCRAEERKTGNTCSSAGKEFAASFSRHENHVSFDQSLNT
ncbi:MAG: hypothetical protein AB1753_04645, partial [Thermoproteota archaeon]